MAIVAHSEVQSPDDDTNEHPTDRHDERSEKFLRLPLRHNNLFL